jgi:hypothetical protein
LDFVLKCVTEHHSDAMRELFEHLDCRDDQKGMALLDAVIEYDVMLVEALNERLRNFYYATQRKSVHSAPAPIER